MAIQISVVDSRPSKTRRFPLLPRVGLVVDMAGKQFVYKHAPVSETLMNLYDRGFSVANMMALAAEQFAEIRFPEATRSLKAAAAKVRGARSRKTA
jgi:hypothetical protein